MNVTVNLEVLIEKGYTYNQIMQEVVGPQVHAEHSRILQANNAVKAFQKAQDAVLSGEYTSDDLVVLQKHLNDKKRNEQPKKVAEPVSAVKKLEENLNAGKIIGMNELDNIFKALGVRDSKF